MRDVVKHAEVQKLTEGQKKFVHHLSSPWMSSSAHLLPSKCPKCPAAAGKNTSSASLSPHNNTSPGSFVSLVLCQSVRPSVCLSEGSKDYSPIRRKPSQFFAPPLGCINPLRRSALSVCVCVCMCFF